MEYKIVDQNPYNPYIIFDLDGTLANITHRLHHIKNEEKKKNFDSFNDAMHDDSPNRHIVEIFKRMCHSVHTINNPPIIVTGRPETHRNQTEKWLMHHGLVPHYLFMRPANDYRSDTDIKKEIVEKYIKKAPILFVLDDRDRVVNMWRELGYKCLQVQKGDY